MHYCNSIPHSNWIYIQHWLAFMNTLKLYRRRWSHWILRFLFQTQRGHFSLAREPLPIRTAKLSRFEPGYTAVGDHAGRPGAALFLFLFLLLSFFLFLLSLLSLFLWLFLKASPFRCAPLPFICTHTRDLAHWVEAECLCGILMGPARRHFPFVSSFLSAMCMGMGCLFPF